MSRSTFYDAPPVPMAPNEVLVRISAICDEFECYGYRRVGAALRHQGVVVNGKKLRLPAKGNRAYAAHLGHDPEGVRPYR